MNRVLCLAILSLCPALLHAEPMPGEPLVEVSWDEAQRGRTRVAVALPPDRSCAKADLDEDRRSVQLSVCRHGGDAESPVLELSFERFDRGQGKDTAALKLHASVRIKRGAATAIGRVQQGDQPSDVMVALR